jgi:hypothetical protein
MSSLELNVIFSHLPVFSHKPTFMSFFRPDLLHQLIKGCFKDHLVTWVTEYIKAEHPAAEAQKILDDIDRR